MVTQKSGKQTGCSICTQVTGRSLLNHKLLGISQTLKASFLDSLPASNDISLFLCGGETPKEDEFRKRLGERMSHITSKYNYPVYYPEDLFIEQVLGHQKQDLLSLENLLADSVHCVVILLQSPGTFTELGAFANYRRLKDKLIVVIEPKYRRRARSFISMGPVRYLRTKTKSRVVFSSMNLGNLNTVAREIALAARDIAKYSSPIAALSNPISSYEFYLSLVYAFDPIPMNSLFIIVRALAVEDQATATTAAQTVINTLVSERRVACLSGELSITPKGVDRLIYDNKTKKRAHVTLAFLSELRLEALNLTLRKDYRRKWAERGELSRA